MKDGQAELILVAHPKMVTHPRTNWVQCRINLLIETNTLPLSQTTVTSQNIINNNNNNNIIIIIIIINKLNHSQTFLQYYENETSVQRIYALYAATFRGKPEWHR